MQLFTTFLGMAIIDLPWWDRRQHFGHFRDLEFTGDFYNNIDHDFVDDFDVRTMTNLITKPFSDGRLKYPTGQQMSAWAVHSQFPMKPVVCTTSHNGFIIHPIGGERRVQD